MAYAIVSFVADQLLNIANSIVADIAKDQLLNIAKDKYQGLRSAVLGVENEINSLSSKLNEISAVLDDAEKRSFREGVVKIWLQKLKNFSYDAEDVLDEWITRIQEIERSHSEDAPPESRRKVSVSTSFPIFKNLDIAQKIKEDIAQKIKELDSRLDQIMKEKDQFDFNCRSSCSDQEPKRVPTTSFVDASEVQGRRDVAEAVIKQLIEDAGDEEKNGPLVISIKGTGGIGKTTLAQLVYGDRAIKERFEIMMWICVSQPFDEIEIAKAIVESATKKSPDLSKLDTLLEKIRSSLSGKKFLLVLDDVWTERSVQWDPFRNALKAGLPGSRILVTTRIEGVVRMMRTVRLHKLDPISDEDSWLLFSRMAFSGRSEEDCRELNDIGKNIVQKCKGLPLAVKVMGSLLQLKDTEEEWQNVLDSNIWELKIAETELFPHLYLSYDDLTPTMKRCLLYCAIFPKDDVMKAETLIRMWMAQGYLTTTNGSNHNQMELKGQEIFRNLAMRSFFQDLEKDDTNSKIKSCKMHDIVHDFVQFLTKNECYSSTDRLEDKIKLENLRHLSWQKKSIFECYSSTDRLEDKIKLENLRHLSWQKKSISLASIHGIGKVCSFIAEDLSQEEITPKLFNGLKSVRVLRLHSIWLEDLPKEIGNLHGSRLKEIPKEIGNLLHLRYIDLSYCRDLKELPDAICSLYNLQTLDIEGCGGLSRLPEGIGNLINLRHLKLRRCYHLEMLPQGITKLTQLRTLDLGTCWCLSRLPEGIGNLTNLRHLNLSGCNSLEMLPQGIAKLTQLRTLGRFVVGKEGCELGDMEKLKQLQGDLEIVFRSDLNNTTVVEEAKKVMAGLRNKEHLNLDLKFDGDIEVSIDVMEALKPPLKLQSLGIYGYGGTQLPSSITRSLDYLKSLRIVNCCNCTSLPPLGKLPSLESLAIWNMKSRKLVGSEFLGVPEVAVAFPKLKILEFKDCSEWEEWDGLREATNVMPCLTELKLSNCFKLKSMPPLGKLPSLERLTIWHMESLKRVGSEFLGVPEVDVAFPKLKRLVFKDCYEWEEWDWLREATNVMPCLTELKLLNCSKLKTVPDHILGKMSPLQSLRIFKCPNLEVDESELSHIPQCYINQG